MNVVLIGLLFVVVGTVAYWALRNAQDFSDANEVIPGVPTNAPKEWAGAHSPEARLHRRLRDAMTGLRVNRSLDASELTDVREALERAALEVDDRLVAVAALPARHKDTQLPSVQTAVEAIEDAVAEMVALRGPGVTDLTTGIEQARTRLTLVEDARRELEGLGAGSHLDGTALRDLRAGIEGASDAGSGPDVDREEGGGDPRPGTDA